MASPGMMQSGLSRELFESWCTDKRNGVIIAGYCVEGTLAKHIMTEPDEICTMSGQKLPLKMSVDYISFSAHTDYQQTSEVRGQRRGGHRGPQPEEHRGRHAQLQRREASQGDGLSDGQEVCSGLHRPVYEHSDSDAGHPVQRTHLPAGDVEQLEAERVTVRVFKSITLVHEAGMVLLEWIANPLNDMYADAVTTVVLEVQSNPNAQKCGVFGGRDPEGDAGGLGASPPRRPQPRLLIDPSHTKTF
ncbi:hypothetical protein F7725_028394 [Dissostichus mawsoni]|uniref:Uncharacterized protein n=1 Tax=Dissostichus mawsoni TaxID=36200 RepID=A0A7J5XFJ3_DISMA|nr:hypothetical protein F7725_028394 [Dissostichus mawsoni]